MKQIGRYRIIWDSRGCQIDDNLADPKPFPKWLQFCKFAVPDGTNK